MSIKQVPTTSMTGDETAASSDEKYDKGAFFPWLEGDEEKLKLSPKVLVRFPLLGAVGLVGSALTPLLSFLVLHFFNGTTVIAPDSTSKMPKPAAWLSVILSANSILVHMAVSQGIAVTWWYRASKKQTTVADLHNTWAIGTSIVNAIISWRAFNYVALATVFVATLPANGILLQNSISSVSDFSNTTHNVDYLMATHLSPGSTASLTEDGQPSIYDPKWQVTLSDAIGNLDGESTAYSVDSSCKGICYATLRGIGFKHNCTTTHTPYVMPTKIETWNATAVKPFFLDTRLDWDVTRPNTISFATAWKTNSSCTGMYTVMNCEVNLGVVDHPTVVYIDEKLTMRDGGYGYQWTLSDLNGDKPGYNQTYVPSPNFEPFPVPERVEVGGKNTTYGGIALALKNYFDSRIVLDSPNNADERSILASGYSGLQLKPVTTEENDMDGTVDDLPEVCNYYYNDFKNFITPADYLLDQIRSTMFSVSVWASDYDINSPYSPPIQTYNSIELMDVTRYSIVWRWYFASLAVTLIVILFILPTFYGFWTLARKTTLSPFETARAFHAPVLHDQPTDIDTPALLKTVGKKNLHTDLIYTPAGPILQEKSA